MPLARGLFVSTGKELVAADRGYWADGAIGPSLRWGDGNFEDRCINSKIDIYRRFVNLF